MRQLAEVVPYADGAEGRLLQDVSAAVDRSSGSDELASHIVDWPTRYHLSRLRPNLLRPFAFRPGMRVLDVGAGTGTLSRYVAESGARVVALEGSPARARVAEHRCAGLPNVEIVGGSLQAFEDASGFDVVLCVGVYEYAGGDDPEARADFLARLRSLTRPGGALILAIENQLGLKYLLGYGEDHTGRPWMGVEGYPQRRGVQTFSKKSLRENLTRAGFPEQQWLFPFPDYKLPQVVLAESAYAGERGPDLVDQLVRWPCTSDASAPFRLCDARRAHVELLKAGLGPDVANSFLVLAGSGQASSLVDANVKAWHFGSERQRRWMGAKEFRAGAPGSGGTVVSAGGGSGDLECDWLRQRRPHIQPWFEGRTLEQAFLQACGSGVEALRPVLRQWRDHLRRAEVPAPGADLPDHPFRSKRVSWWLPSGCLDVNLPNFVDAGGADLHYIDSEWHASGPVDGELVVGRALWYLALDLVQHGIDHPWGPSATVDEIADSLAQLCGSRIDDEVRTAIVEAEGELQARVLGGRPEAFSGAVRSAGRRSQLDGPPFRTIPIAALHRHNVELAKACREQEARSAALEKDLAALRSENASLQAQIAARQALDSLEPPAAAVEVRLWSADDWPLRFPGVVPEWLRRTAKGLCREGAMIRLIRASGLFDAEYYRSQEPVGLGRAADPIRHFVRRGALQGHDPHPLFCTSFYLKENPDVAKSGVNPLVHYLLVGGGRERRDPHPLFQSTFYLTRNPDVAKAGMNPLVHYVRHGASEGRDPSPDFEGAAYLRRHPDLVGTSANPLVHHLRRDIGSRRGFGGSSGLRPLPPTLAT